jgi:hypothetical protein
MTAVIELGAARAARFVLGRLGSARGGPHSRRAGVMLPRMQRSFLFDCDDVALPALNLDPDTELARVVPADVEVRQRAGLHDVECSCNNRF